MDVEAVDPFYEICRDLEDPEPYLKQRLVRAAQRAGGSRSRWHSWRRSSFATPLKLRKDRRTSFGVQFREVRVLE